MRQVPPSNRLHIRYVFSSPLIELHSYAAPTPHHRHTQSNNHPLRAHSAESSLPSSRATRQHAIAGFNSMHPTPVGLKFSTQQVFDSTNLRLKPAGRRTHRQKIHWLDNTIIMDGNPGENHNYNLGYDHPPPENQHQDTWYNPNAYGGQRCCNESDHTLPNGIELSNNYHHLGMGPNMSNWTIPTVPSLLVGNTKGNLAS
ncbi:hypothetical protein PCASD_05704 [Puccinia coronata f. sp. avenae]|uniref:Uncharacterized protein n=1 Tax=Puccinia coronata f. sp. avenae TaxID=200324 RepID=A0A2N5UVC5_9BASI|nr:hypothetical protein PCASD_05704 [Puccinia coronata f. sp. avenae]